MLKCLELYLLKTAMPAWGYCTYLLQSGWKLEWLDHRRPEWKLQQKKKCVEVIYSFSLV